MKSGRTAHPAWSKSSDLTPELRVLVACARSVLGVGSAEEMQVAVDACESVDRLCDVALRHNMLGNLHRAMLTKRVAAAEPHLAGRLEELQRAATLRSLQQATRLLQIIDVLGAADIQVLPYKGPVWAQRLYGDVALRTWSDLDLLVSHSDVFAARSVLLTEGFVDSNPFNERIAGRSRGGLGQIALHSSDARAQVDLHWEVKVGISSRSLNTDLVFSRQVNFELLNKRVGCPSDADQFLMMCLEWTRDRWDGIEKMLALGVQIDRTAPEEWLERLHEAQEIGCLRRACIGVSHVCSVFGLERVPEVENVMSSDMVARGFARTLRLRAQPGGSKMGPAQELAGLAWGFATEDNIGACIEHMLRLVFQPGPEDWVRLPLPYRLEWLHYPLRPLRLMSKWAYRLLGISRIGRRIQYRRKLKGL